jgi:phosphoenolpyruvate phosphomutase
MDTKFKKLKELFEKDGLIRLVGAHNGLTAKLVEENGFEGVWASGFEIATSHALPDADILTMNDYLSAASDMNDATSLPVVADCDTGFGNSNNVIQMVRKYESAGVAAVCIEDKLFPKVNSYVPGRQELAQIAEFVGKIMAAKSSQRDKDFMVFARVEALIAGWGMEEALKRAKAYADAGADAILIHSKKNTPEEIIAFAKAWNNYKPLIIVPTSYPSLTESQMKELKIKVVIYANQGLRAAIKNINNVLSYINKFGISGIDINIVTMQEVFALQGMNKMKEDERKFLKTEKGDVRVIIPAAGDASQEESFKEKDLLKEIPVAMLDINGKSILQRAVENLNNIGLQNISVITGYQGSKILLEGIEKIENPDYRSAGITGSILMAANKNLSDKNLIIYSDILFDKDIVEKLLKSAGDIVLVIDSSYQENRFPKKDLDLVVAKNSPIKEERFMSCRQSNQILKIGKNIPRAEANYEFSGIALISKKGMEIIKLEYEKIKQENPDKTFGLIDVVQKAINSGFSVEAIEIHGGWTEIKSFEDYKRACRLLADSI